jgi:hypothetical protein
VKHTAALLLALGSLLALAACSEESDCDRARAIQEGAARDFCLIHQAHCRTCECLLRDQMVGQDGRCQDPPACEDDPDTPEDECLPGACGVNQRYEAQQCLRAEAACIRAVIDLIEPICAFEYLMKPCTSASDCRFGTTCQPWGDGHLCLEPA